MHKKVPSQSKLTSKYAPTKSKDVAGTSAVVKLAAPGHSRTQSVDSKATTSSMASKSAVGQKKKLDQASIDIGKYDGGLEAERESLGPPPIGEAAEQLAMDSSLLK